MKTLKTARRSVSPFGAEEKERDIFDVIEDKVTSAYPKWKPAKPKQLDQYTDIPNLAPLLRKSYYAPANDAPELRKLCQFVIKTKSDIQDDGLFDDVVGGFKKVFEQKTELFLVDHHNKEQCEALEWDDEYRDLILFSSERDILVGEFFEPIAKNEPALFSKFITDWIETDSSDRILHFIDFAKGSKNPTFEHYLVFSHPTLSRIISNKELLRSLFKKSELLLNKLSSPTWEKDARKTLEL